MEESNEKRSRIAEDHNQCGAQTTPPTYTLIVDHLPRWVKI